MCGMQKGTRRPNRFHTDGPITIIYIRRFWAPDVECLIDTEDLERILPHNWTLAGREPWVVARCKALRTSMHRFVMQAPPEMCVDHIHGNTLDNRKSELRVTTQSVNQHNRVNSPPSNLAWHQNKWRVKFMINWKRRDFGSYESKEQALLVAANVREKLRRGEHV